MGNMRKETESKENEASSKSDNGYCIDDEELIDTLPEKKKISLLGEHYSDSDIVTSGRSETLEEEEHVGIHPDIVKNVDGPTRQRKGRSKVSKKQRSRSGSPGGETEDFSQPEEKRQASDLTSRLEETNV